jgi:hypothetical protein
MLILALDPGPEKSGYAMTDAGALIDSGVLENAAMLDAVRSGAGLPFLPDVLAIEMIASYGMAVGREVFETCVWIGRFQQAWPEPAAVRLIPRLAVKLHLCGSARAKDPNVRQALIDLYPRTGGGTTPQIGTKARPGPLYGVSTHAWPALGVAVTARHQMQATT